MPETSPMLAGDHEGAGGVARFRRRAWVCWRGRLLCFVAALVSCQRPESIRVFCQDGQVMFEYCSDDVCGAPWSGQLLNVKSWDKNARKTRVLWTYSPRLDEGAVAYSADAEPLQIGQTYEVKFCKFVYLGNAVEMVPSKGCYTG